MSELEDAVFSTAISSQEESNRLTERLLEVAQPGTVFSRPSRSGEYTLITASEVVMALGSGYGIGGGSFAGEEEEQAPEQEEEQEISGPYEGRGGGGGGGGYASGRPVAVISIGPDGLSVEPVIDRTKLGIAVIAALGSLFMAMRRMRG